MPARRHSFNGCSHKGFGAFCHRCAQAEKLEKSLPTNIASEKFGRMKQEVERLRGSGTRPVVDPDA
jgi:hypothetical protein